MTAKHLLRLVALGLLFSSFLQRARAQQLPAQSLRNGAWDLGAFAGGGRGLFAASNTQFLVAGVHVGRILTSDHAPGLLRGNFELAGDFMPLFEVFEPGRSVYGGAFTPVELRWNFTSNHRVAPYLLLSGGGLVTRQNVPPGNTSAFNFIAGGSFGMLIFTRPHRAIDIETRWVHISNANLGTQNPQLVSNFILTIGFSWFK